MVRKPEYYGIRIKERKDIVRYLDDFLDDNDTWYSLKSKNRVQSEFHITVGHKNDASRLGAAWYWLGEKLDAEYAGSILTNGKLANLTDHCDVTLVRAVVFDRKLVTVEVKMGQMYVRNNTGGFSRQQLVLKPTVEHLHITIGTTSNAIKPFQLNVLLRELHSRYGKTPQEGEYQLKSGSAEVIRLGRKLNKQQLFILFSSR